MLQELHVVPALGLSYLLEARLESGQHVFDLPQLRRFAILYYAHPSVKIHHCVSLLEFGCAIGFERLVLMVLGKASTSFGRQ